MPNRYVDGFPAPDSKIRTTRFVRAGGGNCANTLVQLARLGADTDIITKVGEGAVGEETVASIAHEGVGMRWLVRDESSSASFTYVIVDTKTDTRTCIHTPSSELDPSEVSAAMLQPPPSSHGPRPAILHLCTRHTLAAVRLAQIAVEEGVPVSVDMEKDRPGLSKLLPLVTYVITNAHFPTALTGVPLSSGDADGGVEDGGDPTAAVAAMCVHHCIRARVAVCTLGKRGSLALVRHDARVTSDGDNTGAQSSISTPMVDLVATQLPSSSDSAVEVSLVTVDGVSFTRLRCPAAPVVGSIVDTTGAGDVFIGGESFPMIRAETRGSLFLATLSCFIFSCMWGLEGSRLRTICCQRTCCWSCLSCVLAKGACLISS